MTVLILASGMALGHYLPAVLLREHLRKMGRFTKLLVYEAFLEEERRLNIVKTRDAYQSNFRKALIGQRLHGLLSAERLAPTLSSQFRTPGVQRVAVFSGHWCESLCAANLHAPIDLIHVDLSPSPSWAAADRPMQTLCERGAREIWLSKRTEGGKRWAILPDSAESLAWPRREERVLVHGGGWALGDLESAVRDLAGQGVTVDVLLGTRPRLQGLEGEVAQYGSPPEWSPWTAPEDRPFPVLVRRDADGDRPVIHGDAHGAAALGMRAQAVVSKPGGMALAESLVHATPLVFLEPYGPHEAYNAEIWTGEGFGIWYKDWRACGFSTSALRPLHENLSAARSALMAYQASDSVGVASP